HCALPLQYIGSPHVADCSIFIFADAKPPGGPDRVRIGDADAFENEEWNERGDIRLDDLAFRILGLIYVRVDARQYPQRKTRFGNTTNVIGLTYDIALGACVAAAGAKDQHCGDQPSSDPIQIKPVVHAESPCLPGWRLASSGPARHPMIGTIAAARAGQRFLG